MLLVFIALPYCLGTADVEEGGETSFPRGRWLDEAVQSQPPYSECAAKGVAVKPRKGDAILFFSLKLDGELKRQRRSKRGGAGRAGALTASLLGALDADAAAQGGVCVLASASQQLACC